MRAVNIQRQDAARFDPSRHCGPLAPSRHPDSGERAEVRVKEGPDAPQKAQWGRGKVAPGRARPPPPPPPAAMLVRGAAHARIAARPPDEEELATDIHVVRTSRSGGRVGIRTLLAIANKWVDEEEVQREVCVALARKLFVGEAGIGRPARVAALPRVLAAMARFPASADLQAAGCSVLHCLAGAEGGVDHATACAAALCGAMDAHPAAASVQKAACMALRQLGCEPKHRPVLAAAGCLTRVYTALLWHAPASDVVVPAGAALLALAWNGDGATGNRDAMRAVLARVCDRAGGGARKADEAADTLACATLCVLASPALAVASAAHIASRGLACVYEAMDRHPSAVTLQALACAFLATLGQNTELDPAPCLPRLLAAMGAHPADALLQRVACAACTALGESPQGQLAMASSPLPRLIVAAMRAHTHSAPVQEAACAALRNLAACDDGAEVVLEVGLPSLITAMAAHAGCEGVQSEACAALRNVAYPGWGDGRGHTAVLPLLGTVYAATEGHPLSPRVQQHALGLLCNIVASEAGVAVFLSGGGLARVLTAVHAHTEDECVAEAGCRLLGNLATSGEEGWAAVTRTPGLQRIVEAMMGAHPSSSHLQDLLAGCAAISGVARHAGGPL